MLLGAAVHRAKRLRLSDKSPYTPDVPGHSVSIIELACKRMVASMHHGMLLACHRAIAQLAIRSILRCGSICSGSGMGEMSVHYGMTELCAALGKPNDIRAQVMFTCENDEAKAEWLGMLKCNSPDTRNHKDAVHMSGRRAHDRISKGPKPVLSVSLLHAGVSCKDISGLNDEAGNNLAEILQWLKKLDIGNGLECSDEDMPNGTTAITLLATLKYILKHKPGVVMVENVKAFQALEPELRRIFLDLGYALCFLQVNSTEFSVPQSRPRIYMVACNRDALPTMPHIRSDAFREFEQQWATKMVSYLSSLKTRYMADIEDYLFPGDSPILWETVWNMTTAVNPPEKDLKWPPRHLELFKSIDCPARPGPEQFRKFYDGLKSDISRTMWEKLCTRQREIIVFFSILHARAKLTCEWAVDTSQNLWRLGKDPMPDQLPCLTGTSRIWLVREQRLLIGEECLAIQGINRCELVSWPESFSNLLLWSLAGNAFTGEVASAVFYAAMAANGSM